MKVIVCPVNLVGAVLVCTKELSLSTGILLSEGKAYKVLAYLPDSERVVVTDDRGKECHASIRRFAYDDSVF